MTRTFFHRPNVLLRTNPDFSCVETHFEKRIKRTAARPHQPKVVSTVFMLSLRSMALRLQEWYLVQGKRLDAHHLPARYHAPGRNSAVWPGHFGQDRSPAVDRSIFVSSILSRWHGRRRPAETAFLPLVSKRFDQRGGDHR